MENESSNIIQKTTTHDTILLVSEMAQDMIHLNLL